MFMLTSKHVCNFTLQVRPGFLSILLWSQNDTLIHNFSATCNISTSELEDSLAFHPYVLDASLSTVASLILDYQTQRKNTTLFSSSSKSKGINIGLIPLQSTGVGPLSHIVDKPALRALHTCAVVHASSWQDINRHVYLLQPWANSVHIVLTSNITLPQSYTAESNGTALIYR